MPNAQLAFAAALSGLLLAGCGSGAPTAAENEAADTATNAQENSGLAVPEPVNGSDSPDADAVPPPDAVSHPDGYLPDANGLPEPTTGDSPASRGTPPATEDEYMRNRQGGG